MIDGVGGRSPVVNSHGGAVVVSGAKRRLFRRHDDADGAGQIAFIPTFFSHPGDVPFSLRVAVAAEARRPGVFRLHDAKRRFAVHHAGAADDLSLGSLRVRKHLQHLRLKIVRLVPIIPVSDAGQLHLNACFLIEGRPGSACEDGRQERFEPDSLLVDHRLGSVHHFLLRFQHGL